MCYIVAHEGSYFNRLSRLSGKKSFQWTSEDSIFLRRHSCIEEEKRRRSDVNLLNEVDIVIYLILKKNQYADRPTRFQDIKGCAA